MFSFNRYFAEICYQGFLRFTLVWMMRLPHPLIDTISPSWAETAVNTIAATHGILYRVNAYGNTVSFDQRNLKESWPGRDLAALINAMEKFVLERCCQHRSEAIWISLLLQLRRMEINIDNIAYSIHTVCPYCLLQEVEVCTTMKSLPSAAVRFALGIFSTRHQIAMISVKTLNGD